MATSLLAGQTMALQVSFGALFKFGCIPKSSSRRELGRLAGSGCTLQLCRKESCRSKCRVRSSSSGLTPGCPSGGDQGRQGVLPDTILLNEGKYGSWIVECKAATSAVPQSVAGVQRCAEKRSCSRLRDQLPRSCFLIGLRAVLGWL